MSEQRQCEFCSGYYLAPGNVCCNAGWTYRELQRLRSEIALRDRCIAWCLDKGIYWHPKDKCLYGRSIGFYFNQVELPAEFAAILSVKADSEVAK